MLLKKLFSFVFCSALVFSTTTATSQIALAAEPTPQAPLNLKVAHTSAPNTIIFATYEKFKEELEKVSNGSIKVTIYPLSQLGGDVPSAESVLKGSIDVASCGSNNMAPFTNLYFWADLPFIFNGLDGVHKVYGGPIGEEFKQKVTETTGFRPLFYADPGSFRALMTTRKPVRSPKDMAGMKFRSAPSPVEMDTIRAFGANPTPVSWTETYMALEQKVVEGEMQQYHWAVTARHEDVIRYVNEVPGQHALHLALMNKEKFNSWSPQVQEWVLAAAKAAQDFNFANTKAWNDKLKDTMLKAKVEIYTPTAEEVAMWAEAGKKVWTQYAEQASPELVQRIVDAQK